MYSGALTGASEVLPLECTARVESRDSGGGAYIVGARRGLEELQKSRFGNWELKHFWRFKNGRKSQEAGGLMFCKMRLSEQIHTVYCVYH